MSTHEDRSPRFEMFKQLASTNMARMLAENMEQFAVISELRAELQQAKAEIARLKAPAPCTTSGCVTAPAPEVATS